MAGRLPIGPLCTPQSDGGAEVGEMRGRGRAGVVAGWSRVVACVALAAVVVLGGGSDVGRPRTVRVASVAADPASAGQWGGLMSWPLVAVHTSLLHTGQVLTWDAWET